MTNPNMHRAVAVKKYKSAKADLFKAREALEQKGLSMLDDRLYRYRTVKRSISFFEERFKRLCVLRSELQAAKKDSKVKSVEREMKMVENDIAGLENRLKSLGDEIVVLNKSRQN